MADELVQSERYGAECVHVDAERQDDSRDGRDDDELTSAGAFSLYCDYVASEQWGKAEELKSSRHQDAVFLQAVSRVNRSLGGLLAKLRAFRGKRRHSASA